MLLKRTTPPVAEPVSLTEAKAHLRVLHATEDALVTRLVKAVREHVEDRLGRSLVTQGWTLWLPRFPPAGVIELPRPPLVSVTSIKSIDPDGVEQTLSPDVYGVYPEGMVGWVQRRRGQAWPATAIDPKAVEIAYVAGYGGSEAAVPEAARSAILLLVEHLYHNRGETADGPIAVNPVASERLLAPLMTHGWI